MRKILSIIGIIAVAAVIGYILFVTLEQQPNGTAQTQQTTEGGFLPADNASSSVATTATPVLISEQPVVTFWADKGDGTLYTVGKDNAIYAIALGQTATPEKIYDLTGDPASLTPSPEGSSIILQEHGTTGDIFSIINPTIGSRAFLPLGTIAATWSQTGKEILYLRTESLGQRTPAGLYQFTVATKRSTFVGPLDLLDVSLRWINADQLLASQNASADNSGRTFVYDLKHKTLTEQLLSGKGLMLHFNVLGDQAITASFENRPDLNIFSKNKLVHVYGLETFPDKCVVSGTALLCGVPQEDLTSKAWSLPDDYEQGKLRTNDIIEIMNLTGQSRKTEYVPRAPIDVYEPLLIDSTFYFINRYDNKLYSIELGK